MAGHSHQPHQHDPNFDWAAMAAKITVEGEVLMPYMMETVSWIAALCRREGWEVRRIVDIGSGPGVGTCVLAQQFEDTVVTAVDGSTEMLEHVAARAKALGLSTRVRTQHAELPDDLGQIGGADLIWAAMVLHHVSDVVATFRGFRSLLEPGGVLAIAEFGDPPRFLPDEIGIGRPGLIQRLGEVNFADAFPTVDFPAELEAAGFTLVADRMAHVHLGPPLPERARRIAVGYLGRIRELVGERLDTEDLEVLDVLMDEAHPLGLMQREDAFLDVSRRIYVARAVQPA